MTVALDKDTWFVPEGHGLLVPGNAVHRASCVGPLSLCTAYIDTQGLADRQQKVCRLLLVSPLLDIALQALAEEPILYDDDGRGGALAKLIVEEVWRAPDALFPLPMPADKRLKRLCESLIETPSLGLDIDSWAVTIGVSRRTLTRRFRSETGLSFAQWRRRLRALRASAQQALGTPDHVAAQANGYASATALRAMIRRMGREVGSRDVPPASSGSAAAG